MEEIRVRIAVVLLSDGKVLMVEHQKDGRTY